MFSLRGTEYQIDLSNANLAKFEKALKPYLDAGSKLRRNGFRSRGAARSAAIQEREHMAAIRDWARASGYKVGGRGRIKAEIVAAFEAVAH